MDEIGRDPCAKVWRGGGCLDDHMALLCAWTCSVCGKQKQHFFFFLGGGGGGGG